MCGDSSGPWMIIHPRPFSLKLPESSFIKRAGLSLARFFLPLFEAIQITLGVQYVSKHV